MIGILGAGVMGSALAIHLARAGRKVGILATAYDGAVVEASRAGKPHPVLNASLEGIEITESSEWRSVLGDLDIAVLAVSTAGLVSTVNEVTPHLSEDALFAVATKGWDAATLRPAAQIVGDEIGEERVVALVGPSLAAEIATATPTALVCASRSPSAALRVAEAFASPEMRTYTSEDVTGVEVGAILKNVVAISIGICNGLAEADPDSGAKLNTQAFLFARGLIEMTILSEALGGTSETIFGLTGAGDLFVTALGGRNGKFGRLVGLGRTPEQALKELNTTVEGVANAATAVKLAEKHGLDLPLTRAVSSILQGAPALPTLQALFAGKAGPER